MALVNKSLGRRRDWPQLESAVIAAGSAGTAYDAALETVICHVPNLAYSYSPGVLNECGTTTQSTNGVLDIPSNNMVIRQASYTSAYNSGSNTIGVATDNADYRINVYRAGKLQGCVAYYPFTVATQIGTAITANNVGTYVKVTPATGTGITGIVPGMQLAVGASSTFEVVTVTAVTATTFTALFTQLHATSAAVTSILVPYQATTFIPANGCSTTASTAVSPAGSTTITPASIYGIHVGDYLDISGGTGTAETVPVTAVTASTFTATFAHTHSSTYNVVSCAGGLGTTGAPFNYTPTNVPFELRGGDVLTLARVSAGNGVATPAGLVEIEWVPSGVNA